MAETGASARTTGAAAAGVAVAAGVSLAVAAAWIGALPLLAAAVAVASVASLVWRRPQRGLLILAGLLPFDGLLLIIPAPAQTVAWKEVLLGVTLLAAFAVRRDDAPLRLPVWAVPLGGLLCVALVTLAWTPPLQGLVGLKVTFFGMLTAAVVWRAPFTGEDRDLLVTILGVTGAITALIGIVQQVVGHEALHELGYAYNSVIRFSGGFLRSWSTFNQPFPFAFFLMVVILVTTAVALQDVRRVRNRLLLLAMPLLLVGMTVAVVRAAWIGLVAGLLYLGVTRHRALLAATPLVLGAVAVAAVLGAASFFSPPSVAARFSRWEQIPAIINSAPFGEGIGTAGAAAARAETLRGGSATFDPDRVGASATVFQPDNSYLKLIFEVGVVGLGFFLAALVLLLTAVRRAARVPGDGLAAGTAAVVVAAAVASLAATFFEIFPLDYLFWMLAAVATTAPAGRLARDTGEPQSDSRVATAA